MRSNGKITVKNVLLTALLFLPAAAVRAQSAASDQKGATPVADDDTAPRPEDGKAWGLTFKQKAFFGNQDYRMSDTYLDLAAPHGLDFNADLNDYSDSTSSASPTITFGAGWATGLVSYTGSYAITTLANDYEADALDFGLSAKTDSQDFRTLFAADVSSTKHRNYTYVPPPAHPTRPAIESEQDLTQVSPTGSVSQRLFGSFDAKATLSESTYNRNILAYTNGLNRTKTKGQQAFGRADGNLTGLIDGFPDWSVKLGLTYYFDAVPLTLRGTYQNIHLEDTAQGTNATADVTTYAADYDVKKWATVSAEYDHTRQTSQTITDNYGLIVELRY